MDQTAAIVAFNVLCSLGSGVALVFICIAFFSKKVTRLPTWYLIMSIGGLYAASMLLLVGSQVQDEEPDPSLCLAQASLVYALPVGFTASGAAFAIQLHLTLKYFIMKERSWLNRNSLLLVFIPLTSIVVMVILIVVLGVSNPDEVSRSDSHMYCRLEDSIAGRVSGTLSGLFALALLITQGFTIALLWPRWKSSAAEELPSTSGGLVSRSTVMRLVVLDFMAFSALLLGLIKGITKYSSTIMNLYIAALVLVGMIAFGISTLPFKRAPKPPLSTDLERSNSDAEKYSVAYSSRATTPLPIHPMTTH